MLIRKHHSIQDSLRIRKVLRRTLYVLRDRRIQLPQERNDLQTDFITEYVSLQIGMVGDVFLSLYPQVLFYLYPGDSQQRAQDIPVLRLDTSQSTESRPTDEVQDHRLHRIIPVMRHTDTRCPDILPELLEITVPEFTRCHFNADMMGLRIGHRIEMDAMERDIFLLTELFTETLIPVRLLPAKMEVTMDGMQLTAHFIEE